MRLAYFSPLPPLKNGVPEYSAELLQEINRHCEVDVFLDGYATTSPAQTSRLRFLHYREFERLYEQGHYDNIFYHIADNPDHSYIYRLAIRIPGVVLLHDFNLHYLVADATITQNDWAGYFAELRYNVGEEPIAHAERVRRGEASPEFERYPLNRRILENSRGLIVNNDFLMGLIEQTASHAPAIVLPHGVSRPPAHIPKSRVSLGLDLATVVGAFGFMKPYKRIHSILRSLHALRELRPEVHLLLAGEEHPHYPLDPLITELGLSERVHRMGFVSTNELWGYIEACDICCNLRFPTVGESSGPLMKIMALGKPVLVSDIGSYSELPDDCCVKIPAGDAEMEFLPKALESLISSPESRGRIGEKARAWALAKERSWRTLADGIMTFLDKIPGPVGRILSLSPPMVKVGESGFSLTATGGPWSTDSSLCWNDCEKPTRFVSPKELRASVLQAETANAGVATISVRDKAGTIQGSQAFRVEYPPARIGAILPAFAVAGEGELLLEIKGGPFVSSAVARWNGRNCLTRCRSTEELEVLIPREELKEACRARIDISHPLQKCSGSPYAVRSGSDAAPETSASLTLSSGFHTFAVRVAPGTLDGLWELSTESSPRCQTGALHFGTGIPPSYLQRASCTFSVMSRERILVHLTARSSHQKRDPKLKACVRKGWNKTSVYEAASAESPLDFAVDLNPGIYTLEVEADNAAGAFLIGRIESRTVTSALHISGWIEETMVGFGAFYTPEPIRVNVTTRCRSLGALGADYLVLDVKDRNRNRVAGDLLP